MRFAGAAEGLVYLREEYLASRARLVGALAKLRAAGLLEGVSIELVIGAGVHLRREPRARVDGGPPRDAAAEIPTQVGYLGRR